VNRIKNRESWRPFAPAMLAETAKHMIDGAPERSPFMLFTGSVTSDAIPAVTHVDRTARYQTVTDADGAFHDLLVAMRDRGAAPVTMNTSLNDRGEPIIESPERALQFFETAAFDTACFNGTYVIRKPS
jgi:carbamoyltransferase